MDRLNIVTLNARGLRDKAKRDGVYHFLDYNKVDISFLQETYCTDDFKDSFNSICNDYVIFHSCTNSVHSRGVSILIRKNFILKLLTTLLMMKAENYF